MVIVIRINRDNQDAKGKNDWKKENRKENRETRSQRSVGETVGARRAVPLRLTHCVLGLYLVIFYFRERSLASFMVILLA